MLKTAISLAQELEYRQGEGNLYCASAELLMYENDWDGAERACEQARVLFEQIGDNQGEGRAQLQALSVEEGRKTGLLIKKSTEEEASYELEHASDSDFPPFDLEAEMSEEERRIYEQSLTPAASPSLMAIPSILNTCTALVVITETVTSIQPVCIRLEEPQ